jgi:23S rRNA (adenine2030-N6)-methyltransferase
MLSYQHAYHAGNRADIHKHGLLASVLEILARKDRPLTYMETHAGRGVYDLRSAEALKTGEAAQGWSLLDDAAIKKFPAGYVNAVRGLNDGCLQPLYPGSPAVAARILRPQDEMYLMELHPQEHTALARNFSRDKRIHIHKRDGFEGVLALSPPRRRRGLVLIDPSYEMKTEYDAVVDFVVKLTRKWPEASILIWAPMLEAGRHEAMLEKLRNFFPGLRVFKAEWMDVTGARRPGMYGSVMAGINLPHGV